MSIFGSIAAAIFGTPAHAEGAPPATGAPIVVAANSPTAPAANAAAPAATAAKTPVDVMAILDAIDDKTDEKLDWSKSIVDLMKLLKLDSSLTARKTLAKELGYTGDTQDSAKMNVWLHKAVMTKLAENGGVVPKDLQH
ncbi:MAG: DUF3597 domain-containing protein [Hyphomicrobiaceae bacterium]